MLKKDGLLELMEARAGRITTKAAREAGYPNSLLELLVREGLVEPRAEASMRLATCPWTTSLW